MNRNWWWLASHSHSLQEFCTLKFFEFNLCCWSCRQSLQRFIDHYKCKDNSERHKFHPNHIKIANQRTNRKHYFAHLSSSCLCFGNSKHSLRLYAIHYLLFLLLFKSKQGGACLGCIKSLVFVSSWYGKCKSCPYGYFEFKNRTIECKSSSCSLVLNISRIHSHLLKSLFWDFHFQIKIQILEFHQKGLSICSKDSKLYNSSSYNKFELFLRTFNE